MTKEVGFKITVPSADKNIKQGQTQSVTLILQRGDNFKRDVTLQIESPDAGVSVAPTDATIKAGDKPDIQLRISATQEAALGKYRITVTGVPKTGEPTSTAFTVKVIAR